MKEYLIVFFKKLKIEKKIAKGKTRKLKNSDV